MCVSGELIHSNLSGPLTDKTEDEYDIYCNLFDYEEDFDDLSDDLQLQQSILSAPTHSTGHTDISRLVKLISFM